MQKILTLDELKILNGGSETDARLRYFLDIAHQQLLDLMEIKDFGVHTVTDERVGIIKNSLYLNEYPVDKSSVVLKKTFDAITVDTTAYTYRVENDNRLMIPEREFFRYTDYLVTYSAGWVTQDTLKINVNTGLVGKTIVTDYLGVLTTYTFVTTGATALQINVGATATDTATNIASKIGGTSVGDVVSFPLGKEFDSTSTILSTDYTFTANTIPSNLKLALSLIVSGIVADKQKAGGIIEITVSKKTVKFATGQDAKMFDDLISKYIYKKKYSNHA